MAEEGTGGGEGEGGEGGGKGRRGKGGEEKGGPPWPFGMGPPNVLIRPWLLRRSRSSKVAEFGTNRKLMRLPISDLL